MFVTKSALELFHISRDTVDDMRAELAALKAELSATKSALSTSQANFEWIRTRVNTLEVERAQLIERAYGITVPVPEIARAKPPILEFNSALFDDMGDKVAKDLGLPYYGTDN